MVGKSSCKNGRKQNESGTPLCPGECFSRDFALCIIWFCDFQTTHFLLAIGRIRHIGSLFDSFHDPTGGLPVTANSDVAGLAGGFGWLLQLDDGPPKDLKIDRVEIDSTTLLVLAIPYPPGTAFSITAHAAGCHASSTRSCTEHFVAVNSVDHVRHSPGNVYHYDTTTSLLYVRVIQFPGSYTGDTLYSDTATWHLWDLDTPKSSGSR